MGCAAVEASCAPVWLGEWGQGFGLAVRDVWRRPCIAALEKKWRLRIQNGAWR